MLRMSRIVLTAALCTLPTLAWGQLELDGPAPAEPGNKSDSAATDAEEPEKFERSTDEEEEVAPIPGTTTAQAEPTAAGDTAALLAEIESLRKQLAQLKADLELLQADHDELEIAVGDHATAINEHAQGLKVISEDQTVQAKKITDLQAGQEQLAGDLADVGETRSAAKIPADMTDEAAREELLRNTRYRLRIHNTTAAEQPVSINGVEWLVRADEWSFVPVAQGPVTVRRAGKELLEIEGELDQWQSDDRGFHIDYDLDSHQVLQPEETK
jgi:hypothetical protein